MRPISAPHSNDIMENPLLSSRAGSRGGRQKERPAGGRQERKKGGKCCMAKGTD